MRCKRINNITILKVVFFVLSFIILSCSSSKLSLDKNLVNGQLKNGLKYYIYKNQIPSKFVHMGILFNVGSLNEEENERGLAHYLEHMAFKGTEDYPGSEDILEILKKFGMKFGADLNAYTTFDKTYYYLDLPDGGQESEVDEALNVLKNWAFQIKFDDLEIDKERNVIIEEKKYRDDYSSRMFKKMFEVVGGNSRYFIRFPIGLEERILSFKSEDFKKFYNKWYRPDLTSVIIVGDIDPKDIEEKIKKLFASFKKPLDEPEKVVINLDTVIDKKFVSIDDDETLFPSISFVCKEEIKGGFVTVEDLKRSIEKNLLNSLFINRFYELKVIGTNYFRSFDKFDSDYKSDNNYILIKNISLTIDPEHFKETFEGFFYEIERIRKFGFTKGEIDKIKSEMITSYTFNKDNLKKQKSSIIADRLVGVASSNFHLLDGNEFFDVAIKCLNNISPDTISALASSEAFIDNMTVIYKYSKKLHSNLTFEELQKFRDIALNKEIKPYDDVSIQGEFFKKSLQSKNIVDEKEFINEISSFTLENGVEVYFKHNENKKNIVDFTAISWGGLLSEDPELIPVLSLAPSIVSKSGYGDYSKLQIEKYLSNKLVTLMPSVSERTSRINGGAEAKDLETLFKLIYFTFNEAKIDDVVLQTTIDDMSATIKARKNSSNYLFSNAIKKFYNNDDYRLRDIQESDLQNISKDILLDFYKKRFTYADNFKFIFVGDIDLDTIKKFSSKYLGNLNSKKLNEFRDLDYSYKKNTKRIVVGKKEDAASSTVYVTYPFTFNYTPEEGINYRALASLLSEGLVKAIRREQSSVYGINASFDYYFRKHSDSDGFIIVSFTVEPKALDSVLKSVNEYILDRQKIDFVDTDFDYIKKNIIKNNNIASESNDYWSSVILNSVLWHDSIVDTFSNKFVDDNLNKDTINMLFKKIDFKQGTEIVLIPSNDN
ncbi:Peptidase, M16 family protein [Borrelia crocidurae DOU]|uniref:Peptidase, M16 family protein n=1 Tax=Borrelia crocidurae DOU TaxID=1293575 RepID=W5SI70_9SPIR|nr:insulinase family protein [Borrelia crocidurae]AHH06595.1 Peptidase, M16 family protein [Borrelia crocidurae DOU]